MSATIRDLQLALLNMLVDIDQICRENKIQYSLACGTALGAVRHHGFIPWDDDMDIMFLRSDYERFLEIAPPLLKKKGYTLQKDFSKTWPMPFSKVRKDNTTFIENYEPKIKMHQGIFIDLFPIDNLSDNPFFAFCQWEFFHLLVAQGLHKRGYKTDSLKKKILMLLSPIFPQKLLKNIVMLPKKINTKRVHSFFGSAVIRKHNYFSRDLFSEFIPVSFEGFELSLIKGYDTYLKTLYNNYMELPPLEKRQSRIHAKVFDLEKSYLEYMH